MKYPKDLQTLEQFLERWNNNTLDKNDPVYYMVTHKVPKIAASWNWSDWADDFIQETFRKLIKGNYRGEGPLEAYIASIMGNLIKEHWRKERRNLMVEITEDLQIPSTQSVDADLELSDRMKRLITRTPQELWWYIVFIVDFEGYASERDAAEYGKVTRYQIQKIKEEIRRIWSTKSRAKGSGGE